MMKKNYFAFSLVAIIFGVLSSSSAQENWTNLLDKDLSQWNIYLSYKHANGYDGDQPKVADGVPIEPIGYDNNVNNVFTMELEDGKPVLHISGEYYGCAFTMQEFENYHLSLQVKWGNKKWDPRKNKLKDSGVLYHSIGEAGVDYWQSWMLSQEFQIMEGHMGDYWSIANSAIDVRAYLPEGMMNTVAGNNESFLPIGSGTQKDGFCLRTADYESSEGEWTTLELLCFEDKSLHIVNGNVVMVLQNSRYVNEGQSTALTKGKIQLQSEAAEVFYKDVRIKSIDQIPEKYSEFFD